MTSQAAEPARLSLHTAVRLAGPCGGLMERGASFLGFEDEKVALTQGPLETMDEFLDRKIKAGGFCALDEKELLKMAPRLASLGAFATLFAHVGLAVQRKDATYRATERDLMTRLQFEDAVEASKRCRKRKQETEEEREETKKARVDTEEEKEEEMLLS